MAGERAGQKQIDLDLDIKIGAVAGHNGEALRGLDLKLSRRAGRIRSFKLKAKIGRDTPLIGDLRLRSRDNHQVLYLETDDAGALFRFTDIYPRMYGGQMWVAMDPPTPRQHAAGRRAQHPEFRRCAASRRSTACCPARRRTRAQRSSSPSCAATSRACPAA